MLDLTVIIPSYNTKEITYKCLTVLTDILSQSSISSEIIVIDNASTDGTQSTLQTFIQTHPTVILLENSVNVGFAKANNYALKKAQGEFILFLNSDVVVEHVEFKTLLEYLKKDPTIGALTVRVNLQTGDIDPASHRGFPTIWRSFCYFTGLEKISGHVGIFKNIFGGYHLTHMNLNIVHEVDAVSGAFFLTRRELMETLGGFDEIFFMYGEDIDLAFRIKKQGYKVVYYPLYSVLHLKSVSGLKKKNNDVVRNQVRDYFYNAMRLFYEKHYARVYPSYVNRLIYLAIDLKKRS